MTRDEFMKKAHGITREILQGKENGIMNLVQQAWAEGKRNAEVETLRTAIDEALDRREAKKVPEDAVYPTWEEWLVDNGVFTPDNVLINGVRRFFFKGKPMLNLPTEKLFTPIPADIAQKLGLEPKEV